MRWGAQAVTGEITGKITGKMRWKKNKNRNNVSPARQRLFSLRSSHHHARLPTTACTHAYSPKLVIASSRPADWTVCPDNPNWPSPCPIAPSHRHAVQGAAPKGGSSGSSVAGQPAEEQWVWSFADVIYCLCLTVAGVFSLPPPPASPTTSSTRSRRPSPSPSPRAPPKPCSTPPASQKPT